ncbi:MAG TPA: ABC transporter permease [Gemmatimonadaceae bacterium]
MSALADLVTRLRSLVFRRREERELEEELRFHVDMEAERLRRAGLNDAEARRRGAITLGGVERTKEDVRDARGTRLFEELVRDLSFAVRTLARGPGFAIVVILTLAIGIGGTTAVFSAVDAVLLQPLPYQQPGRMVRLYQYFTGYPDRNFVTPLHYLAYRQQLSSFDHIAAALTYDAVGKDIRSSDHPERIRILPVSADYFDVVRVQPAIGRAFGTDEENGAPSVILSHDLFERVFHGNASAVGRTLLMSGEPYTIVGVMPAGYVDPLADGVTAWVPLDLRPGLDAENANNHYLDVIGRLRPGISLARAQSELDAVGARIARQYTGARDIHAILYPLKDDVVGAANRSLELMLGAVGLVLLLVCVNVATLLLVRGSARTHEFALRVALGAGRARVLRQLFAESVVLALAGDIAGLVVARLAMSAIVALGAGSVPRLTSLSVEPRVLGFSLLIATASAVLFGFAPALRAARAQPVDALRAEGRALSGLKSHGRLRTNLVIAQVALAFVLVVGAGLLLISFHRLRSLDLGVKTNNALVFELHLPDARYDSTARARFYDDIAGRLERLPGVRAAGGISKIPASGSYHNWGTQPLTGPMVGRKDAGVGGEQRVVSGDYFRAAGIPILEGRAFDARDAAGTPLRVVVSVSAAARLFPGVDAIGQRLRTGGHDWEVIGVVPDVAVDVEGRIAAYVYHAHAQFAGDRNWSLTQIVSTTGRPEALLPIIRRTVAAMDPQLVVYRAMTLNDAIGQGASQQKFTLTVLGTFALVALGLAALGIFGALSYGVKLRSREFGVRMALGAERGAIQRLVLRQGLAVSLTGVGIGLAGAIAFSRVMASVVFHVRPLDPFVLAGAAAFIVAIGALAASVPAHRATSVDPRSILQ